MHGRSDPPAADEGRSSCPDDGSVLLLAEGVLAGDRRAVARAISLVEAREPGARALLGAIYPHTGGAYTGGVTGAPT